MTEKEKFKFPHLPLCERIILFFLIPGGRSLLFFFSSLLVEEGQGEGATYFLSLTAATKVV